MNNYVTGDPVTYWDARTWFNEVFRRDYSTSKCEPSNHRIKISDETFLSIFGHPGSKQKSVIAIQYLHCESFYDLDHYLESMRGESYSEKIDWATEKIYDRLSEFEIVCLSIALLRSRLLLEESSEILSENCYSRACGLKKRYMDLSELQYSKSSFDPLPLNLVFSQKFCEELGITGANVSKNCCVVNRNDLNNAISNTEKHGKIYSVLYEEKENFGIDWGTKVFQVDEAWSHMCQTEVSTLIRKKSDKAANGTCDYWRTEAQQLIQERPLFENEGSWEMRADAYLGTVRNIHVIGYLSQEFMNSILREIKNEEGNLTLDLILEETVFISIPYDTTKVRDALDYLSETEMSILKSYLHIMYTRYNGEKEIHNCLSEWDVHHGRGVQLYHELPGRYKELSKSLDQRVNSEGVLVRVRHVVRFMTISMVLLAFTGILIIVYKYSPRENCNESYCFSWNRLDAMFYTSGFFLAIVTASELLIGSERGLGALARGRVRYKNWRLLSFCSGVSRRDLITLLWRNDLKIVDPDSEGMGIFKLLYQSNDDYDHKEGKSWSKVEFPLQLGKIKGHEIEHLVLFDEGNQTLITERAFRDVKVRNGKLSVVSRRKNHNEEYMKVGDLKQFTLVE